MGREADAAAEVRKRQAVRHPAGSGVAGQRPRLHVERGDRLAGPRVVYLDFRMPKTRSTWACRRDPRSSGHVRRPGSPYRPTRRAGRRVRPCYHEDEAHERSAEGAGASPRPVGRTEGTTRSFDDRSPVGRHAPVVSRTWGGGRLGRRLVGVVELVQDARCRQRAALPFPGLVLHPRDHVPVKPDACRWIASIVRPDELDWPNRMRRCVLTW